MKSNINDTEKVSIMIPTMDRAGFVTRALSYYAATGFKGQILIGDSSNSPDFEKVRESKRNLDSKLNIFHRHYPRGDYSITQIMQSLSLSLKTDYACFSGDDDFLVPRVLGECAAFLDENTDHVGAHGQRITFKLEDGYLYYGKITETEHTREPCAEHDSALDRFVAYMRYPISSQYYLMRKSEVIKMYSKADLTPTRYFGEEILPCALSVISGKIAEIDSLQTVFQIHDKHHFSWHSHNMYDLVTDPFFPETIEVVRNTIVEALIERDSVAEQTAEEVVVRELWRHISGMLSSHFKERQNGVTKKTNSQDYEEDPDPVGTRGFVYNLPGITKPVSLFGLLRFLYRKLRVLETRKDKEGQEKRMETLERHTLTALIDVSSSYYKDFFPIYHFVRKLPRS